MMEKGYKEYKELSSLRELNQHVANGWYVEKIFILKSIYIRRGTPYSNGVASYEETENKYIHVVSIEIEEKSE